MLAFAVGGCASDAKRSTNPGTKPPSSDYAVRKDVVYTPAGWPVALQADLYLPEGQTAGPGVVLVYGGSWSDGDHRWQMTLLARRLARRGYTVMVPQYRGTPRYRYPAPVEDVREALRWLRRKAPELKVSGDRIALYGFSAGGHLAACVGVTADSAETRAAAVVAASAPLDLTLYPTGEILPRFLGATYAVDPELYRRASPINHVSPDDPPFFLYHGTGDKTVSPEHTRHFKAALDRAGVRNEVYWLEGKGHAATLIFGNAGADAAIDFLDTVLRR